MQLRTDFLMRRLLFGSFDVLIFFLGPKSNVAETSLGPKWRVAKMVCGRNVCNSNKRVPVLLDPTILCYFGSLVPIVFEVFQLIGDTIDCQLL